MTREEFLARCGNAYDVGLCTADRLVLLERWLDFVSRLEGGQMRYVAAFLESEARRTDQFMSSKTLASDSDGYALLQLAAILTHPCQQCAVDRQAWWTRRAFCEHKDAANAAGKE